MKLRSAKGNVIPWGPDNCAVRERTADGVSVGRCWFYLPDGRTCPRHGDVGAQQDGFRRTGELFEDPHDK